MIRQSRIGHVALMRQQGPAVVVLDNRSVEPGIDAFALQSANLKRIAFAITNRPTWLRWRVVPVPTSTGHRLDFVLQGKRTLDEPKPLAALFIAHGVTHGALPLANLKMRARKHDDPSVN